MEVTSIEKVNKSRVKVYIDGEYAFPLYNKDIILYQLEEGKELSVDLYESIKEEVVFYRSKLKAMSLLMTMDRTEFELRQKLQRLGYPHDVIDKTIAYLYSYGYIDDNRYASSHVNTRKYNKSKLMLKMELLKKGIDKDVIEETIRVQYSSDENSEDPEILAIKKAISKKRVDLDNITWEDKQKLIAFLYRKGFSIDKINQAL
ncbi:MAG TPA: regulatory protein RecX [Clostridiales bacterium]|nr:regulatory protein RecX [Clostridiales bacterium]